MYCARPVLNTNVRVFNSFEFRPGGAWGKVGGRSRGSSPVRARGDGGVARSLQALPPPPGAVGGSPPAPPYPAPERPAGLPGAVGPAPGAAPAGGAGTRSPHGPQPRRGRRTERHPLPGPDGPGPTDLTPRPETWAAGEGLQSGVRVGRSSGREGGRSPGSLLPPPLRLGRKTPESTWLRRVRQQPQSLKPQNTPR